MFHLCPDTLEKTEVMDSLIWSVDLLQLLLARFIVKIGSKKPAALSERPMQCGVGEK